MAIQFKRPSIERVIRFFYWPKTMLVGNSFECETYDDVKKTDGYHTEKVPSSPSIFLKFIAVFLYPFLNPIAWMISFSRKLFNPELEEKINEEKLQSTVFKIALKDAHEDNMQNLTGQQALRLFDQQKKELKGSWKIFIKKIRQEEDWVKYGDEFNNLFKQASNNYSFLLVAMSKIIAEEKKIHKEICVGQFSTMIPFDSVEGTAYRIVTQPQVTMKPFDKEKAFGFRLDTMLLTMYLFCRKGMYYGEGDILRQPMEYDEKGKIVEYKDIRQLANSKSFYIRGTQEYSWRQTYNTNIKLFYSLFGGKSFKSALASADDRFLIEPDTSKDTVTFTSLL